MKKKDIYKVLKTLRKYCRTKECCSKCELCSSCFANPHNMSNDNLELIANVLKDFVDGKETEENDKERN